MLLKVMKGGVKGVITPLGHLRRGGVGGHYPLGQSYRYGERGTQPAGRWPKNGITAGSWIAEWMDRRVVRELSLLLVTLPPPKWSTSPGSDARAPSTSKPSWRESAAAERAMHKGSGIKAVPPRGHVTAPDHPSTGIQGCSAGP